MNSHTHQVQYRSTGMSHLENKSTWLEQVKFPLIVKRIVKMTKVHKNTHKLWVCFKALQMMEW